MKIAVTGGNGRFGRVVVAHLAQQGHEVVNIDRVATDAPATNAPFIALDLADVDALMRAFEGCDAVVHLAAFPSPRNHPAPEIYANNTVTSYNVLHACATLGIQKLCMASSINAIGGAYSRKARYDYFPVDEQHPTYNEDPYSLSKWVQEIQADSFARLHDDMTISNLRLHGLHEGKLDVTPNLALQSAINNLWAYTDIHAGARAVACALNAKWRGHEVFFITAPHSCVDVPSLELAQRFFPQVPIHGDLTDHRSFYNCSKAERLLGWKHDL